MTIPYWVADSKFFQIFPDRFDTGNPKTDPPNVQPWGVLPTNYDFQGGIFRGIIQLFDYLLEFGINTKYLYANFHSSSNHRHKPYDYFQIDLKLGDKKEFQGLLGLAHRNIIFTSYLMAFLWCTIISLPGAGPG